jgi:putative ABC transport system permease protein
MFHEFLVPIKLAFKSIRSNVGRTLFSLLGIVIGVAAVILVLSFGMGIKNFVVDQISSFGTDIVAVEVKTPKTKHTSSQNAGSMVGGSVITTFKLEDAQKLAENSNVKNWYGWVLGQEIVAREGKKKQMYVIGATPGIIDVDQKMELESGAMYSDDDREGLRQVVVIGSKVRERFFPNSDALGETLDIKGKNYKVIGTLKERGLTAFFDFDDSVFVPLETLQKKILGMDYIPEAIYQLKDMSKLELTILEMEDEMREQHDIDDPEDDDFSIMSISEVSDILDNVFVVLNILLLSLTSISLVVGGVGIMNVMYVTVTERTYEIGLKKAIGAKGNQILNQFLFEAIFITLLGGVVGFIIGFGLSKLGEIMAASYGYELRFDVTWWSAVIGLGFSGVTGIVFGYFPAKKASKLSPMEALRKE